MVSDHVVSERLTRRRLRHAKERAIELVLFLAASVSVATTIGIVVVLLTESLAFFREVSIVAVPDRHDSGRRFLRMRTTASLPLLAGTLVSSAVALLVAIPLGTIIAIYLSEFAPFSVREIAKPFLELLGGIPTIVFGYFALLFVTPLLQTIWPSLPGFNLLSAGLVMGIMIIPYVSSLSEDAMRAVPMNLREGSYAMGATRLQTAVRVVAPAAFSGIAAAYILRRLARGGRDDDRRHCRRHAAESHVEPRGARGDDHGLYRAGGAGRSSSRLASAIRPFSPPASRWR